jgi:two-component system response regulator HydG
MNKNLEILLVDDDAGLRVAAEKVLASEGYRVTATRDAHAALDQLKDNPVRLLIADLVLPDLDGLTLLTRAKALRPDAEVVMITGHGSIEKAVEAMKLGAYDFIEKPLDSTALLKAVAKALEKQRLATENQHLRRQLRRQRGVEILIGDTPAMQALKKTIRQIAPTDVSVLIQGESGTGKELVADAIHELSERRDRPLVKVSCAAIPETLLESELFGHERGAFTGALATKAGKFELADGGTLLLDEIAEMSPQLQAKLLRVLQDGRFTRVGGTRELQVNVRLLSATHTDIAKAIEAGRFRQDLYYRINTVQIPLPPLRDRRDDLPRLAAHFLQQYADEMRKEVRTIAPAALEQLLAHPWPGNVRELEHVIERAVALSDGQSLNSFAFAPPPGGASQTVTGPQLTIPLGTSAEEATRQLVSATIQFCGGNKLKAARLLGIAPRTMYRHFGESRK